MTGGARTGDGGYFVQPTVITDVKPDMSIVREEIFGPVVVAEPFTRIEEVIPAGESNPIRTRRRHLDPGHLQGPPHRRRIESRHGVGQLL